MLASTTILADTPHALAISSITNTTSKYDIPGPPYSSGTVIPMKPCLVKSSTFSHGYCSERSISAARGAISFFANSRAVA